VRGLAPLALLAVVGLLVAGCGGKVVAPVADTVIGKLPTSTGPKGDPAAGKALFAKNGCAACHTFKAAGAAGKVGPDLDKLPQEAGGAKQPLEQFVRISITDPNGYVAPGFNPGVMPSFSTLTPTQVADLVAFLTKSS
jgi:mono/diheme cytochrome c family protein